MTHDGSYRLLFSHPELIQDLVRYAFGGRAWCVALELNAIERVNASFQSDVLTRRDGDVIWRIPSVSGEEHDVHLLLEFQSSDDRWMAVRVAAYSSLLLQQLLREQSPGKGRPKTLPTLLCVVLYNGDEPWSAPLSVSALRQPLLHPELREHQPEASYTLIDARRYTGPADTHMGMVCELEKARTPRILRALMRRLQRRLRKLPQLERAFAAWLQHTLLPSKGIPLNNHSVPTARSIQEVQDMTLFEQWQEEWKEQGLREGRKEGRKEGRQEGRQEGRKEGRQEGRQEGQRAARLESLEILYNQRFGPPSEAIQAALENILDDDDAYAELLWTLMSAEREDIDAALLQR